MLRHSTLFIALTAACLGLFLLIANLAERPHEGGFVAKLALIAPLGLYLVAGLRRFVR
jgi:hypothetical protein